MEKVRHYLLVAAWDKSKAISMTNKPPYNVAKAAGQQLEREMAAISRQIKEKFPQQGSGPRGLTPDHIKSDSEYKKLQQEYQTAIERLRKFNQVFEKAYKKEIREERRDPNYMKRRQEEIRKNKMGD